MRVAIETGHVTLLEPARFDGFDVCAPGLDTTGVLDALGADGRANDQPGHVFVSVSAVRRMAGDVDGDWERGFEAMLAYAEAKGWLDDTGEYIAAHIAEPDE